MATATTTTVGAAVGGTSVAAAAVGALVWGLGLAHVNIGAEQALDVVILFGALIHSVAARLPNPSAKPEAPTVPAETKS